MVEFMNLFFIQKQDIVRQKRVQEDSLLGSIGRYFGIDLEKVENVRFCANLSSKFIEERKKSLKKIFSISSPKKTIIKRSSPIWIWIVCSSLSSTWI